MYHAWAVCEWHLGNPDRAQVLLDQALRLTTATSSLEDRRTRALLFFSMAQLEDYKGQRPLLVQHFIGLALQENALPLKRRPGLWKLWAKVARDMGNESLRQECLGQADEAERALEVSDPTKPRDPHWMKQDPWLPRSKQALLVSARPSASFEDDFTARLRFPRRSKPTKV